MSSFFKTINKFGLTGGINVFMSLKLNKQPFSLPPYGHNIYLRSTNSNRYTFKEIFFKEQYEIGNIIENPKFIIDAGTDIGISTVYFAKKYPTAKVFAIEPDPENGYRRQ